MNAKRIYKYLVLLFVAVLLFSLFIVRYAVNWLSDSSQSLTSIRGEVEQLKTKQTDLERAKKALSENGANVEMLSRILPKDKDQARVVEEIYAIANLANVTIDSIAFPSSTLGSQSVKTPTATEATPSNDPASQQTTTITPEKISQATPLKEVPGVQYVDLTLGAINSKDVSVKGVRYEEMMTLIKLVERNRRTMQIQSIDIGQGVITNGIQPYDVSLAIRIYLKP